jgi:hypothetical protein
MEAADILYGVTIESPGVSKLIGIRLRDADEYAQPLPAPRPSEEMEEPMNAELVAEEAGEL